MEKQEDYLIEYLKEALVDAQKVGDYLVESGNWVHTCSIAKIQAGLKGAIMRIEKQDSKALDKAYDKGFSDGNTVIRDLTGSLIENL